MTIKRATSEVASRVISGSGTSLITPFVFTCHSTCHSTRVTLVTRLVIPDVALLSLSNCHCVSPLITLLALQLSLSLRITFSPRLFHPCTCYSLRLSIHLSFHVLLSCHSTRLRLSLQLSPSHSTDHCACTPLVLSLRVTFFTCPCPCLLRLSIHLSLGNIPLQQVTPCVAIPSDTSEVTSAVTSAWWKSDTWGERQA